MLAALDLDLRSLFPDTERWADLALRIAATVVVAFLVQRLLYMLTGRIERLLTRARDGRLADSDRHAEQRARTLGAILRSLGTVVIVASALIHVLDLFGWDVKPLLAGAGILGVALGFGAQTLVRDVIAGFFILAEDQFGVGDLIEVSGKAATVEAITVRCTTLRDFNGYVHFVPNGEMKVVTNRSRGWNRAAVDVVVAAHQDVDRALEIVRRVADQFNTETEWRERLLDPVSVWGVESLTGTEILIRMVVRTRPGADLPDTTRELRRRISRAMLAAGVHATASAVAPPPVPAAPAPSESPS